MKRERFSGGVIPSQHGPSHPCHLLLVKFMYEMTSKHPTQALMSIYGESETLRKLERELRGYQGKADNLESTVAKLQGELASVTADKKKLQTDLLKALDERDKAMSDSEQQVKMSKRHQESGSAFESKCNELEKEVQALQQVEKELRRDLASRCEEIAGMQVAAKEAATTKDRLSAALQDLTNLQQRLGREREEAGAREQELRSSLEARVRECESLTQGNQELASRLARLQEQQGALENKLQAAEGTSPTHPLSILLWRCPDPLASTRSTSLRFLPPSQTRPAAPPSRLTPWAPSASACAPPCRTGTPRSPPWRPS